MPEKLTQGQRVELVRKRAGLTQAELAGLVGVGSRPHSISEIETGKRKLGRLALPVAEACGTTTDFLLGLIDDPAPSPSGLAAEITALPADRRAVVEQLVRWLRGGA